MTPLVDAAPDLVVGDLARLDLPLDVGPDSSPSPVCDKAILGQACTPSGGECGAAHDCLPSGHCSCKCVPDLPETKVLNEDSCPAPGFACGLDAASGERYCFALLANTPQSPDCTKDGAIQADPTDPAFMVAARITPTSYPFTVTGMRYMLHAPFGSGKDCDNGLAHRAEAHISDQAAPEASPAVAATFNAAAVKPTTDPRWVVHPFATEVKLTAGQSIYLLVEVVRETGKTLCPQACSDTGTGEKSFIDVDSNQPPYQWESFKAKQWEGELSFSALGFGG